MRARRAAGAVARALASKWFYRLLWLGAVLSMLRAAFDGRWWAVVGWTLAGVLYAGWAQAAARAERERRGLEAD